MKNCVIIDKNIPQQKGNFHMHTERSWDSQAPVKDALEEYKSKGYKFCVITDHEVYFDSDEYDSDDFIALSGAESAFITSPDEPAWLLEKNHFTSLHINLINDVTQGPSGFKHNQVLMRPVDCGLSSWNNYIEYCRNNNQLVIINHPNWSRMAPEIFMGMNGCFAFEVWNTDATVGGGCQTDEITWDYCLNRGKRILALTGDDTHRYGPENHSCGGGFTMVQTGDFSRCGLVSAIKAGKFYPSTGPVIYDMRISDDTLHMEFSPAKRVAIIGGSLMGKGFCAPSPEEPLTQLDWKIKPGLKYFRVQIYDANGGIAWSQPVFTSLWDGGSYPVLREDPHTAIPEDQKGLQKAYNQ